MDWFQRNIKTTRAVCGFSVLVILAAFALMPGAARLAVQIPFGILFLAALTVLSADLIEKEHMKRSRLKRLSSDERLVLREYAGRDERTIPWMATDGKPKSLASEGILFRSPDMEGVDAGYVYYTIRPWIFEYIKENRRSLSI